MFHDTASARAAVIVENLELNGRQKEWLEKRISVELIKAYGDGWDRCDAVRAENEQRTQGREADQRARDQRVLEANRTRDPGDDSDQAARIREASVEVRQRQVDETQQRTAMQDPADDADGMEP